MRNPAQCFFPGAAAFLFLAVSASAHDLPLSYVDLRISEGRIDATVESTAKNFARELQGVDEAKLLDPTEVEQLRDRLRASVVSGLTISSNGETLQPALSKIEPLPAQRNLRLRLQFLGDNLGRTLHLHCRLFHSDPRHRTFLNIYDGASLKYQGIFDREVAQIDYIPGGRQSTVTVVRQFLLEGIRHIFIGPDHILFIVGLLLLGGSLAQLLKIVTAFTIAHSITLVLATLNILSPPARVIEPTIALSIIFVGAHALVSGRGARDWRLLFAFGFGFIHGFGFANVLREMDLPRAALGWSLFSFNVGVEIGQACIVLAVAPLLAFLYRRNAALAGRIVTAAAFGVVFAGAYWFAERLFPVS